MDNILSVDVEEIFHAEYVSHSKTNKADFRTPDNLRLTLKLFREYGVKATFFVVGQVAEKYPQILEEIRNDGHEVGFHGWSHKPLWAIDRNSFGEAVSRFKKLCPDCIGYRAPSFSLKNDTRWALEVLRENGFRYDSSIFPTITPLYGMLRAPIRPYVPSMVDISKENGNSGIQEFPLAVYDFFGLRLPIAGGFWLRFWDVRLIKKGIRKLNARGIPAILYVHTWEFDSRQPRVRLPFFKRYVTYSNLPETKNRLLSIMKDFSFTNFKKYLKEIDSIGVKS